MTIQECYRQLGGDFAQVEKELGSAGLVKRFIGKFLDDGSFSDLCIAMAGGDRDKAFRAAHTLKGVSMNLSFHRLGASSKVLTETLRGWESGSVDTGLCAEQFMQVAGDYEAVVEAVRKLADEK